MSLRPLGLVRVFMYSRESWNPLIANLTKCEGSHEYVLAGKGPRQM